MKNFVIIIINFYKKYLSPFLPASCRFYPSCSAYSLEAVKKHGIAKGLSFSAKRIVKCHPFHQGGYDPVPIYRDSQKAN
ncbi:MAG: membrane protein insertion efficiency factor YidD [Nitrospirae bacterium]|nr:membrane protein insertion efficiency factor YidD [Nitrospirota bacterium]